MVDRLSDFTRDSIGYMKSVWHIRGERGALVIARALLIERARTKRLRAELAEARERACTWRDDAVILGAVPPHPFPWEGDDA